MANKNNKSKTNAAKNVATPIPAMANTTAYEASKSKQNYKSKLAPTDCGTSNCAPTDCGTPTDCK